MKILIDQNISFRLIALIQDVFPNIAHVKTLNLIDNPDFNIFMYARKNSFDAVLTLDEDFYNILLEHNAPPKVIWLRFGNTMTQNLADRIENKKDIIKSFIEDLDFKEIAVLEIDD